MAGRACGLGGSCQRALLGFCSERRGLVALQPLCKPLLPPSCPLNGALCRGRGCPGRAATDSLPGMETRRAAFNPFLALQQDFDPSLLSGGLFSFFQHQERKTTQSPPKKPNQGPHPPKKKPIPKPSKKTQTKKPNKEKKITFFRPRFSTN